MVKNIENKRTEYFIQFFNLCDMDFKILNSLKKPSETLINNIINYKEKYQNVKDTIKINVIQADITLTSSIYEDTTAFDQKLRNRLVSLQEYKDFIDKLPIDDTLPSHTYIKLKRKNLSEKIGSILTSKSIKPPGSGNIYTYNDIPFYLRITDTQIDKDFNDIKKEYDKLIKVGGKSEGIKELKLQEKIQDEANKAKALYNDIISLETSIKKIEETIPASALPKTISVQKSNDLLNKYTSFFDFFIKKELKPSFILSLKNLKEYINESNKKLLEIKIRQKQLDAIKHDKIDKDYTEITVKYLNSNITEDSVKKIQNKRPLETLVRKVNTNIDNYNQTYIKMTVSDNELYDSLNKTAIQYETIHKDIKGDTVVKHTKYDNDLTETNALLVNDIKELKEEEKKSKGGGGGDEKKGGGDISKKESSTTVTTTTTKTSSSITTFDYDYDKCLQELKE